MSLLIFAFSLVFFIFGWFLMNSLANPSNERRTAAYDDLYYYFVDDDDEDEDEIYYEGKNEDDALKKWSSDNIRIKTRKMGDLYPIIEGPVKFRDGKKVNIQISIIWTRKFNEQWNGNELTLFNINIFCIFFSGNHGLRVWQGYLQLQVRAVSNYSYQFKFY